MPDRALGTNILTGAGLYSSPKWPPLSIDLTLSGQVAGERQKAN
jgi:hypothetical protein